MTVKSKRVNHQHEWTITKEIEIGHVSYDPDGEHTPTEAALLIVARNVDSDGDEHSVYHVPTNRGPATLTVTLDESSLSGSEAPA